MINGYIARKISQDARLAGVPHIVTEKVTELVLEQLDDLLEENGFDQLIGGLAVCDGCEALKVSDEIRSVVDGWFCIECIAELTAACEKSPNGKHEPNMTEDRCVHCASELAD